MEDTPVHRNFYDSYADETAPTIVAGANGDANSTSTNADASKEKLLHYIHEGVIGRTRCINTPFGWRRPTYADYTASGKPLAFIEDYLVKEVLPTYANTHTLTSFTGLQTTLFRKEARDIVARCMRGGKDDVLIFTGSGSTAALKLLLHLLNLPARQQAFQQAGHEGPHLIVLLGPYEHHSNLLPWREAGGVLHFASESPQGGVDIAALEKQVEALAKAHPHATKIGAFSAASNVSGILTDSIAVSRVLHRHGFMNTWDYASAAPYVEVDANPNNDPQLAKDAIVVSPHKFIGGPGSSGALLIKKSLLQNRIPHTPGGGTVFFVSESKHRYLENAEEREEGGTPDILAGIRAGLTFQLKEQVGMRTIARKEEEMAARGLKELMAEKNIVLMGNPSAARLPIFSFMVRFHPTGDTFLHSGFVSALLNDLFGIQTRSGCLCAGPYAQRLLGMTPAIQQLFEDALVEKYELLRPGFVRFNLAWWLPETEVDYILQSVRFVARHGWRFLPLYTFILDSGEWKHRSRLRKNLVGRHWLSNISYANGSMSWTGTGTTRVEEKLDERSDEVIFKEYTKEAESLLAKLEGPSSSAYSGIPVVEDAMTLPDKFKQLKWFVLPNEVMTWTKDEEVARAKHKPCVCFVVNGEAAPSTTTSASLSQPVASTFALIAPTTSLLPESTATTTTTIATKATTQKESKPASSASSSVEVGQKRSAPSAPSKNQQKRDAKKQKKEANNHTGSDSAMVDTDESMNGVTGEDNSSKSRVVSDGLKENVCKNCWHVHWNQSESESKESSEKKSVPSTKECPSCPCITYVPSRARSAKEVQKVGYKIQKTVGRAIKDYGMIRDGDKVLIGISGGKDSLTLFHILRNLQRKAPIKFELGCVTVDPQTPEYDPSPLKAYFKAMNVPYFYESQPILAMAKEKMDPRKQSICSFCSRMKRGVLYTCLRREGYNVLALGQHLDDLCESLFMSIFHNGMLRTMKANYHAEAGDIRIIRPLLYVRERLTREYANIADLPVINENCPACFEAPKERQRVKLLLASQENVHPNLYSNMLQSGKHATEQPSTVIEPSIIPLTHLFTSLAYSFLSRPHAHAFFFFQSHASSPWSREFEFEEFNR